MKVLKSFTITILSLLFTSIILVGLYLFLSGFAGLIILVGGVAGLFLLFILSFKNPVSKHSKFFKWKGKVHLSFLLSYLLVTGILLIFIGSLNFVLGEELGELSARDKLNLLAGNAAVNTRVLDEITDDYSVRITNHMTFKFPAHLEPKVDEIIERMDEVETLEKQVFGEPLQKTKKLEIIILANAKEYSRIVPWAPSSQVGSYVRHRNRIMIYQQEEVPSLQGIFSHEYSHYLLDIFLEQNKVDFEEIPKWYHEGVSEYVSLQVIGGDRYPHASIPEISLNNLRNHVEWNKASRESDVYYLAEKAIEYAVGNSKDRKVLSTVILQGKETGSFEESFQELTGFDLTILSNRIYTAQEDLNHAYATCQNSDYETSVSLYQETVKKHPGESLAWHQYALCLVKHKKWNEAISVRRTMIGLEPNVAGSYITLSQLLTLVDTNEAVKTAEMAEELGVKENREYVDDYYETWLAEITRYHRLMNAKNYEEAYQAMSQSEQLSTSPEILEELNDIRNRLQ
ncbi:AI-2E family transporter [Sporosarcina gallistercoris]|uniref:MnhB domain-containing protein n=1 Tax=Sporosarcina gallistercoris TaxID=2762245 RepID=A0ABR8PI82_9BACL|nr:ATP synthase subunit I [Sporosarcina gallistercoris]MBD7907877.1 MnhB domain-containing protein [Sporosarcina gallistercoris]